MTKTILIADDNLEMCQTLKDIFENAGYSVKTVKNGYEVLAYLKKEAPRILVLDLMMPDKDGLQILSSVKNISPDTKIIIYTGFQEYEDSAYAREADRFLLKEGSPDKLLQAVKEMV